MIQARKKMPRQARAILQALAAAALLTILAGTGILNPIDYTASDALYQQREAADGKIVLLGIDQQALEAYGPYNQWGRDIMAQVLETLNRSEEDRPAVIGIDILFAGETELSADTGFAEAAAASGNVVTACLAQFGRPLLGDEEGGYVLGASSVLGLEDSYEALRSVTGQGHINAMLDTDGILRHHLLRITLPDGSQIPSLALACASAYEESRNGPGLELPAVSPRGFWYLPFCGNAGDFEEISIAKVLSGEISASYFSGKIVLIGPYAPGLQDSYVTAMDHASPMYRVEYHANAIQAQLSRN